MRKRQVNKRGGGVELSPRFFDALISAEEREYERESADHIPVCTCPETMKIDGVLYECKRPTDAGCRVHAPQAWEHYIPVMESDNRVDGKISAVSH